MGVCAGCSRCLDAAPPGPDLTGRIRTWLGDAGFDEESFAAPSDAIFSVGVNRYARRTLPAADPPATLFTFIR